MATGDRYTTVTHGWSVGDVHEWGSDAWILRVSRPRPDDPRKTERHPLDGKTYGSSADATRAALEADVIRFRASSYGPYLETEQNADGTITCECDAFWHDNDGKTVTGRVLTRDRQSL